MVYRVCRVWILLFGVGVFAQNSTGTVSCVFLDGCVMQRLEACLLGGLQWCQLLRVLGAGAWGRQLTFPLNPPSPPDQTRSYQYDAGEKGDTSNATVDYNGTIPETLVPVDIPIIIKAGSAAEEATTNNLPATDATPSPSPPERALRARMTACYYCSAGYYAYRGSSCYGCYACGAGYRATYCFSDGTGCERYVSMLAVLKGKCLSSRLLTSRQTSRRCEGKTLGCAGEGGGIFLTLANPPAHTHPSRSCTACPAGSYSNGYSNRYCYSCPSGYTSSAGSSRCQAATGGGGVVARGNSATRLAIARIAPLAHMRRLRAPNLRATLLLPARSLLTASATGQDAKRTPPAARATLPAATETLTALHALPGRHRAGEHPRALK